jgi:hypothetical protein
MFFHFCNTTSSSTRFRRWLSDVASNADFDEVVRRFGAVAERYCAIVDSARGLDKNKFLLSVYRFLPELISEAIRLPDPDPNDRDQEDDPNEDYSESFIRPAVSQSESSERYALLKEKLGDNEIYWTVFDPTQKEESIGASLADDLASVYLNLKEGLLLRGVVGATAKNVIWEWRFLFYTHWGDHAISALRTIHNILDERLEHSDS